MRIIDGENIRDFMRFDYLADKQEPISCYVCIQIIDFPYGRYTNRGKVNMNGMYNF